MQQPKCIRAFKQIFKATRKVNELFSRHSSRYALIEMIYDFKFSGTFNVLLKYQ